MILDDQKFQPVFFWGVYLIVIGTISGVMAFQCHQSLMLFSITVASWFLSSGVAIVTRTSVGFFFLKANLYLCLAGWPSYHFAKRGLRYIEENEIKQYFGRRSLRL